MNFVLYQAWCLSPPKTCFLQKCELKGWVPIEERTDDIGNTPLWMDCSRLVKKLMQNEGGNFLQPLTQVILNLISPSLNFQ